MQRFRPHKSETGVYYIIDLEHNMTIGTADNLREATLYIQDLEKMILEDIAVMEACERIKLYG